MLNRRGFVARMGGVFLVPISSRKLIAQLPLHWTGETPITVYKSSTCGCCTKWVDHLRANSFKPTVHDRDDMDSLKDELGVPQEVRSCHTAVAGGYLIEGHVPASDIRRLLAERPEVAGLAVPGMPAGTPGMAEPGAPTGGYDVSAFGKKGATRLYARH
ncbi:MAG TPA: DUF411 domain-containing protein [Gemmatimonadales bacterium]|nr:DUF411 domain-containing protein [Gemmatimonadales bacterium]